MIKKGSENVRVEQHILRIFYAVNIVDCVKKCM